MRWKIEITNDDEMRTRFIVISDCTKVSIFTQLVEPGGTIVCHTTYQPAYITVDGKEWPTP